jgi:hypothetical protein
MNNTVVLKFQYSKLLEFEDNFFRLPKFKNPECFDELQFKVNFSDKNDRIINLTKVREKNEDALSSVKNFSNETDIVNVTIGHLENDILKNDKRSTIRLTNCYISGMSINEDCIFLKCDTDNVNEELLIKYGTDDLLTLPANGKYTEGSGANKNELLVVL